MKIILAIETSCDDTCASVISDGKILSNIKSSQIKDFEKFGGVIPELSARLHLKNIDSVVKEALEVANVKINKIEAIAYTVKPGLMGPLHVGAGVAKTLSLSLGIPLLPIDHIEGHIFSAFIDKQDIPNEFISLVVSGGSSSLYITKNTIEHKLIGSKIDDAIGEAFDKVAKLMGLPYPGGPEVDALAVDGESNIKMPKINTDEYNFSFSGIKSAVKNYIDKNPDYSKNNLSCSFQTAAINHLLEKLEKAKNNYNINNIVISGGVSSNSHLRKIIKSNFSDCNLFITDLKYTTDNAAMIANTAFIKEKNNSIIIGDLKTPSKPKTHLGD